MAQQFPYTYYACACAENKSHGGPSKHSSTHARADDDEEQTFDPRNPRSAYALYPLTHLLYCEDCRQLRCPRCIVEETLNWYCPSCLFEVPSSVVKSDGNRCTRNCYNCPVCTAPMTVNSLEEPGREERGGPYVLGCPYCRWTSSEIGVMFEKPTGITGQLARIGNGGTSIPTQKERDKERERMKEKESKKFQDLAAGRRERDDAEEGEDGDRDRDSGYDDADLSHDDVFANLSAFYKGQLAAQTPANPFSPHDLSFSSPSSFSRIMNLYSSTTKSAAARQKPTPMREAASALEGLVLHAPAADQDAIERIRTGGWSATLAPAQHAVQSSIANPSARFDSDLRPLATLLQTKRGKRCSTCRHILSKPESKITSTRYKIKLLALNHIPRLSVRFLPPPSTPQSGPGTPSVSILPPAPPAPTSLTPAAGPPIRPGIPTHFLLHLSNPLFDPIKVTLATPSITPGRVQSRVTILCPQFDVGANTDVWDDALANTSSMTPRSGSIAEGMELEAGKPWDKGRNWTSVAVEVVPGFLDTVGTGRAFGTPSKRKTWTDPSLGSSRNMSKRRSGMGMDAQMELGEPETDAELGEDEDVLEIPIFVRVEWEQDVAAEDKVVGAGGMGGSGLLEGGRERREEAFWTVVGVGRIVEA